MLIMPEDDGVLCPSCVVNRAAKLPGALSVLACINTVQDERNENSLEGMLAALRLENADYCAEISQLKHVATPGPALQGATGIMADVCPGCEKNRVCGSIPCSICGTYPKVIQQQEKIAPPLHPFDLRIHIGGEDWEYVRRSLRELLDHVEERDAADAGIISGGAGGCFSLHVTRREISVEDYQAELQAWWEAGRGR
jgi:hypothetical protein